MNQDIHLEYLLGNENYFNDNKCNHYKCSNELGKQSPESQNCGEGWGG